MVEKEADIFRNSGVALVAGIPNVGGTLSFFLDKILPSQIEKQYDDFILSLSEEVKNLQIEVNESIVHSDEFISLFNRMIEAAVCEYSEKKRAILRNLLLSAITSQNQFNYNDYFEHLVAKLTIDEIRWLCFTNEFTKRNGVGPYPYLVQQKVHHNYDHISHITNKLIRYKLLNGSRISDLGKQFIQFINSPINIFDQSDGNMHLNSCGTATNRNSVVKMDVQSNRPGTVTEQNNWLHT